MRTTTLAAGSPKLWGKVDGKQKHGWLVVWNMAFIVGNVIIPTDSYFFGGVGIPPTRQ